MGLDNPIHIAFLLIVLLLVFGAKRLPEMGKSLGAGMRGFKDSLGGELPHDPPAAHRHEPVSIAAPVSASPPAMGSVPAVEPVAAVEHVPAPGGDRR